MSIGDNIRNARITKGLSQKDVADALTEKGEIVGNTTISNWEMGNTKPDADTITLLCEILETDANSLLGFNPNKNDVEEYNILFDKLKDVLTDDDREQIKFIVERRKRLIDKQLGNKD